MKYLPVLCAAAALLAACGRTDEADVPGRQSLDVGDQPAASSTPVDIAAGQQIARRCAGCHGAAGISDAPETPHLAGQEADYALRAIEAYRTGLRTDPTMRSAVADLTTAQLRDVTAYFAGLAPPGSALQMAAEQQARVDSIQSLLPSCGSCHGADGNSSQPGNPSLAGQHTEYLAGALRSYRDGRRPGGIMETLSSTLTDDQIAALAEYYAAQSPVAGGVEKDSGDHERGRSLAARCAPCHGEDGNNRNATMPSLAGQDFAYLQASTRAYAQEGREHAAMRTLVAALSDADLRDLAAFYAAAVPAPPAPAPTANAPGGEPAALAAGRKLAQGCGGCHGMDGNATVPGMPSLTGQHPDYLRHAIKTYRNQERRHPMMEAMVASLSEADIQDLAIFYAVQSPRATPNAPAGEAATGQAAAAACAGCHGDDGNSTKNNIPSLAGQDALYLAASTTAYQAGDREHSQMKAALEGLSTGEIRDLAAYFALRKPLAAPDVHAPLTASQWAERCDRCHGADGVGQAGVAPRIAGQRADYLRKVLAAYQDETRKDSEMHAMTWALSEPEIKDLAAYYSGRGR